MTKLNKNHKVVFFALSVLIGIYMSLSLQANAEMSAARVALIESAGCPSGERIAGTLGPIIGLVAPTVISYGVDYLESFLNEEKNKYGAAYSATVSEEFYLKCGESDGKAVYVPRFKGIEFGYGKVASNDSARDTILDGLSTEISMRFVADLIYSPSTIRAGEPSEGMPVLFRVAPTKLIFNKPVSEKGKEKDLVITLNFKFVNSYDAKKGNMISMSKAVVLPTFEDLEAGSEYELSGISSEWIPVGTIDPDVKTAKNLPFLPFSVEVVGNETEKGKGIIVWSAASKAISDNKDNLKKALQEILLPKDKSDDKK